MKASGKITKKLGVENLLGRVVKVLVISMTANGKETKNQDAEHTPGRMVANILETGNMD